MKKILTLALAALMMVSVFAVTASAADTVTVDPSAWTCHDDAGNVSAGMSADADGKITILDITPNWTHFSQVVTVKESTEYVVTFTMNLSSGTGLRFDMYNASVENSTALESNCIFENIEGADNNKDVVVKLEYKTAEGQTQLKVDFRSGRSWSEDPWFKKAVGTVSNFSIVEKTADAGDNADTGSIVPAMITVAFIAAAGVVVASKKRH